MADAQLGEEELISLVEAIAKKFAVPASLLYAQIQRESRGVPTAVGDAGKARGLMQVHPAAAEEAGFSHEEMFDPAKNVEAGAGYLARQLPKFKFNPARALSAYNAGPTATRAAGGVAPSAADYVQSVGVGARGVAQPGGPFAEELQPLPDSATQTMSLGEVLDRDRVVRILNQLFGGTNAASR